MKVIFYLQGPLRKSGQSADEKPKEKEKQEVKSFLLL
jgi:hypothetical protein